MTTTKTTKLPSTIALVDLIRLTGLTTQRLNKLERLGIIAKLRHGAYPLSAVTSYCQHQRELLQGTGAGRGLTEVRRALTHEKFLVARLERQRLERKLLPVDQVITVWRKEIGVAKTRLLGVARLVAPRLAICKTQIEAEKLVYDAIWNALSDLSRMPDVDGQGEDDGAEDIEDSDEIAVPDEVDD